MSALRELSTVDEARCEVRLWAHAVAEHDERASVARACMAESLRAASAAGASLGELGHDAGLSRARIGQIVGAREGVSA